MLIEGKWTEDWQPVQATDAKGGFVRQISSFRNWVTPDGAPGPTGTGGFAAGWMLHLGCVLVTALLYLRFDPRSYPQAMPSAG